MSTASAGTSIGNYVTIGHNAVLTACTVGDVSLIGASKLRTCMNMRGGVGSGVNS